MVTFTYNGRSNQFRNPIIGNTDELSFQRVSRTSRGGDIIIFRDSEWPKTEVFNLTFDFDRDFDYQRLLNFIRESIGQIIQYTDHENNTWSGVIQNPEVAGQQSGLNNYQVNVLFEVA